MAKITIDRAISILEEFSGVLENAYWESSNIDHKDNIFNLLKLLQLEMMELMKVSVQDHHYHYEPIATQTGLLHSFVKELQENKDLWIPRLQTQEALNNVLPEAIKAFK